MQATGLSLPQRLSIVHAVPFHPSTPFHENILETYQRKQFWYDVIDVNSASTVFRRNILSAKHDTTLDSLSILVNCCMTT